MKIFTRICLFAGLFILIQGEITAQIGVTVSGTAVTSPALAASYTDLATALNNLNAVTSFTTPGTIIFTCAAGTSETAPVKGFVVGSSTLNPVLSATNTVTIVKAAGAATTINAGVGTANGPAASPDGMLYLNGADHITINGLTFTDGNSASATVAMEFGIAFFKRVAGDGCNNNTIQNCTFNMQRINNAAGSLPMFDGSWAIEVLNSTAAAATTVLTPTNGGTLATNGTNSGNKFYTNIINNGNGGIGLSGFAATSGVGPAPVATTFLGDLGNDVGGTAIGSGNTILNFGGGAATNPSAGIRANNEWSVNIQYNTVNNNDGSGVNHATTLRGIYAQAGTSANATINNNTITIQSGATSSALAAIENGIGSTALSSNTININNNTIRFSYTTATSGVFNGIVNSASAGTVNISSNNIQQIAATNYPTTGTVVVISGGAPGGPLNITNNTISNFVMTGATGTLRAINATTPTGLYSITANTIENISYTTITSTGSVIGIYNLTSAALMNVNSNIIRNLSTPTTGTLIGIQNNTVAGTFQCQNNQIYNFTTTSGGAGGFSANGITWSNANVTISGNIIYSINSTGTTGGTGGTINGIVHSGAAIVSGNAIYDISSNSTNVVISGINVNATGTNTVSNNLIGDLRAPNSTGNIAISGILVASGTTNNIFHNTVNIAATTTSATTFGTSAIYFSSSTPVNNLRNNIFVNTSSPGPTGGFTAAIRYTIAPTSTNFPAGNNNNFYYAGVAAANRVIYCEGSSGAPTNGQQTIADYKTYIGVTLPVAGREGASVSEVPNWASTTGSNPITNFLRYNTGIPTQIEQGGLLGTGISTDFAGTTRCPGGGCPGAAATPDRGAWELNGTPLDLSGPSITYTTLGNTSCLADRTLAPVTATDGSGVNITAGTRPRMYYKKIGNANAYVDNTAGTDGWKFVEATGAGGSPFSFTTNYSLLFGGSPITTDVIQYFVVAQDIAGIPNIGINSGAFAAPPTSVALTAAAFPLGGTINQYTLVAAGLSGTVTIGAAQTYPTLTVAGGAFEDINTKGISGNLIINIIDGSVAETGAIALNAINYNGCAAGPYNVTIKPNTTATLTGSVSSGALIKLNGADNVTIDGSNSGGTDKSLTIINSSITAPTVVSIISLGVGAGATSNTVKNCNISTGVATSIGYGISVGGSTSGTSGADNDNITIQNNAITLAPIGIYANGTASVTSGGDDNLNITGNTITYNGTLASLGIQVGNSLTSTVSQNTVSEETTSSSAPTAISLETGFVSSTVTRNTITKALTTNTSGYGGRGITVGTGTATSSLTISNNCIAGINGSNFSAFSNSSSMGIAIGMIGNSATITTTAGGLNIYNNTVNMTGSMGSGSTTAITAAIYVGTGASALDIRNNLFVNTQVGTSTTQKNYAIFSDAANTAFININRNDYSVSNTFNAPSAIVGRIAATDRADIAAWRIGSGQDVQSFSEVPTFVSSTDLHLNMGLVNTQLESSGASVGVTVDIDGQTRPGPAGSINGGATAPDIGCDEFDGVPAVSMSYISSTVTQVTGSAYSPGINQQIIRIQVVTAGTLSPLSLISLNLNANGTTAITDINASTAKIYYTGASTTFSTGTLFGSLTPTISNFTVGGTQTLLTGNNYFWLAYDVIPGATAGNLIDGECTSITISAPVGAQTPTVTAPAGNKIIVGPMSGNYNVGAAQVSPNFATLTSAVSDLNGRGVSGAVTLTLLDASYSGSEVFPLTINAITGASATNTIKIRPAAATTSTITGSSSDAILVLNDADFVTIDGSNTGATANVNLTCGDNAIRNLTISNTNIGTASAVISVRSGAAGAQNNTIKNVIVNGQGSFTTLTAICLGGATNGSVGTDNDNNRVENCSVKRAIFGIYNAGASAANQNTGTVITQNDLSSTGADRIGRVGILVFNENGVQITKNCVGGIVNSELFDVIGIGVGTQGISTTSTTSGGIDNAVINFNKVDGITQDNTYSACGIAIAGNSVASNTIANNMISGVIADANAGDLVAGIFVTGATGSNTKVYFNTVSMSGDRDALTTPGTSQYPSFALAISGTDPTVDSRNNILVNSQIVGVGANPDAKSYSIGTNATTWVNFTSNFNDFSGSGANYAGYRSGSLSTAAGTNYATNALWNAATGKDAASLNVAPMFTSATDLHLIYNMNAGLDDLGTTIAGITMDYDMQLRGTGTPNPDMGADEFEPTILINLKVFIEGYMLSSTAMQPVLNNQGLANPTTDCDNITVELHDATFPYALGPGLTFTGILQTDGTLACTFPGTAFGGNYFIVVKHRSALQTWSNLTSSTIAKSAISSFDFTTVANKAFGDNMVLTNGVYAMYSGDIDTTPFGDGEINLADFSKWISEDTLIGNYQSDLNGDGEVNLADFTIWNVNNGLLLSTP